MVSDKFYLFGFGKNNSNKLPGKSEWKIFNDCNSSPSSSASARSNRPQDDWLHVGKSSDIKYKHSSYGSMHSNRSSPSSCSSIKIPSNNEYYAFHKRAYKQEVTANKENKTRFPTTTGLDQLHTGNRNTTTSDRSRARSQTTSNSSSSSSSSHAYKPAYQTSYLPYHSEKRTTSDKMRSAHGDVLLDWASKMDP